MHVGKALRLAQRVGKYQTVFLHIKWTAFRERFGPSRLAKNRVLGRTKSMAMVQAYTHERILSTQNIYSNSLQSFRALRRSRDEESPSIHSNKEKAQLRLRCHTQLTAGTHSKHCLALPYLSRRFLRIHATPLQQMGTANAWRQADRCM